MSSDLVTQAVEIKLSMVKVVPIVIDRVEAAAKRWPVEKVEALFELPFNDLLFRAQQTHRQNFDANELQLSSLLSIKTGACPEDCKYCPQSARYDTGLEVERLMRVEAIVDAAKRAKKNGASRFCMGAAWRSPKDRDLGVVEQAVREVSALGLETCATLGMLNGEQAIRLKNAGLDYYNHNLDTSEAYYKKIITTRTYQDRLDTLDQVRMAGINVCSGGIVGMGETRTDRAALIANLASLPAAPQSVPINNLIQVPGTPMDDVEPIDEFEFIRTIAAARITMPSSYVRLSAGRASMNDQMQALCFMAGANSVFYGEELLTTNNASVEHDRALMSKLGIRAMP
ncbi:MAG: biotin synthase [Arenicella sp.]|jgi:biotin synthase